jgi:hypothetical protein
MDPKVSQEGFLRKLGGFLIAAVAYSAFAIYLYQPYLKNLISQRPILLANPILASLGCYVLSRRWIASFPAALFAGGIYGFGAFGLGLGTYQSAAGLAFAAVPWLFCPAAFWHRLFSNYNGWRRYVHLLITSLLSLLPFAIIVSFFFILASARFRLFPIPIQTRLRPADMIGLLSVHRVMNDGTTFFGLYHLPLSALVLGVFVFFTAQRLGPMMIFILGFALAFSSSIFQVSPLIWTAVPLVCCSILVGLGIQALAWATAADRNWLLICACVTSLFAAITILLGLTAEKSFFTDATMYALAAILVLIMFFIVRSGLRLHWFRWLALSVAFMLDIFIGAQSVIKAIL